MTRWKPRLVGVALGLLAIAAQADSLPALPALNIDLSQTSVSGISSGGFMAVQFQVANSSIVRGAGIVAAGPYACARADVLRATTLCSCTGEPLLACRVDADSAEVPKLLDLVRQRGAAGSIDDPAQLAKQNVVILSGGKDGLVPAAITQQLANFYSALGVPAAQVKSVPLPKAGHTMPTPSYGAACAVTDTPYIGKCAFDGAKTILEGIYGPLKGAASSKPKGQLIEFDQTPYVTQAGNFLWSSGMDRSGRVYVPPTCARGEPCRLHIALHGCKQGQSFLPLKPPPGGGLYYGTTFVRNAGYLRWADNNRLVVLFPQAVSIPGTNPNGCWDWWGYTDSRYAERDGVQIRALRAMAEALAAGAKP